MAHYAQKIFFHTVKDKFPNNFKNVKVIDCGSLNVNGSLKDMFSDSEYKGVDIVAGDNVDEVCPIHKLKYKNEFDTVISGEMLEHDEYWKESLLKMFNMCKSKGIIAISCAGKGRKEHGTIRSDGNEWGTGNYYMNIEPRHIQEIYKENMFIETYYEENDNTKDTYFYGVKK